jgi:hypothetical protein
MIGKHSGGVVLVEPASQHSGLCQGAHTELVMLSELSTQVPWGHAVPFIALLFVVIDCVVIFSHAHLVRS